MKTYFLGVLYTLLIASPSWGANLTAPFEMENADVLPAGVRSPRFKWILSLPEKKFGEDGISRGLGDRLNKQVTWADILDGQEGAKKNLADGVIQHLGFTPEGLAGETTGEINTAIDVKVPIFAMGITDQFTVAVALPIYTVDISADTGFVGNDQSKAFVAQLCSSNPAECHDAKKKLDQAVQTKTDRLGYDPITSRHFSAIGDVKVVGKIKIHEDEKNKVTLKPFITLPTGTPPDPDQIVDIPTGDGQTDLALGAIWDHSLTSALKWNLFGQYTLQLPDSQVRRVPDSQEDPLTGAENREDLSRDLGDQLTLGSGLTLGSSRRGFMVGAGYQFQYAGSTSYTGRRFSRERYGYLEDLEPEQLLHSATLTASFSTIDWYQSGAFFYPMQIVFNYSQPFAGKNVPSDPLFSAEWVLFF